MDSLTELEMRILAELEEAGEENPAALLNTVIEPKGEPAEIVEFQRSLKQLVASGFIRVATHVDSSGRLMEATKAVSLDVLGRLTDNLSYDALRGCWTNVATSDAGASRLLQVVSTFEGKQRGRELINSRGWGWYRSS